MAVNNEIGSVQDLRRIGQEIRKKNPGVLFHTDAVQGYGKIPLSVKECGIDLLSVSGHKFHGPKGTGFLYVKKGTKIRPILFGGGQQNGLRSGTDNVPGAVGLAAAAVQAVSKQQEFAERIGALREGFLTELRARIEGIRINGAPGLQAAPPIVSRSVPGVRAEVLQHAPQGL